MNMKTLLFDFKLCIIQKTTAFALLFPILSVNMYTLIMVFVLYNQGKHEFKLKSALSAFSLFLKEQRITSSGIK